MDAKDKNGKDPTALGVYIVYLLSILVSFCVIIRIVQIQTVWKPDPRIAPIVTPSIRTNSIEPVRGSIKAMDGRLLALTVPVYDVAIDCTIKPDSTEIWLKKARGLAAGLARIVGHRSEEDYYKLLREGRVNRRGYVKLCTKVDRDKFELICDLPLLNEGKYGGGLIYGKSMVRTYPYGSLARRTIGFVRDEKSTAGNKYVGIEGKFNHLLHGVEGVEHVRLTDNNERVRDYSLGFKAPEDGADVITTLDIDLQDMADNVLRKQIDSLNDVEGGCLVLMDVKTGAIRAMVNLLRDSTTNRLVEEQNLAVGRLGEPGSVFKTVTLTSVLSDRYIKSLDEKIPTNRGIVKDATFKWNDWEHLRRFGNEISIIDGFKISSNYVFATLAIQCYKDHPKKYIDNLYMYKLGEAYDFDIDGMGTPSIPVPDKHFNTTLGSVGYGYSTLETPLHILTFYNALANKGKMMKPYLIEDIEKHGEVIEHRGPSVLNAAICSKAVADTVTRALRAVTEEGTARALKGANYEVAGKTGTSFALLPNKATGKMAYEDERKRKKYQATFVGFFPQDDPRYSCICMIYSKPTIKSYQGGGIPARVVRVLVDRIYCITPIPAENVKVK